MSRVLLTTREEFDRARPEYRPWLALLAEAERALRDPLWAHGVSVRTDAASSRPASQAPRLDGAVIAVEARGADRFVRHLFQRAALAGGPASLRVAARDENLDALSVLEAAVCQDASGLEGWGRRLRVSAAVLSTMAGLAATPLLHACRRTWQEAGPPLGWTQGYCPVCGAWPTVAEAQGLERRRQLRCGRCGSDWPTMWLSCPYCGNGDHSALGSLTVGESGLETRKIETCLLCRGYLKILTTLQATPPEAIAFVDLATIELDVAALERGYARPDRPAYSLRASVVRAAA
jgi:FdhE protein